MTGLAAGRLVLPAPFGPGTAMISLRHDECHGRRGEHGTVAQAEEDDVQVRSFQAPGAPGLITVRL